MFLFGVWVAGYGDEFDNPEGCLFSTGEEWLESVL